jgi:hypothetical protein
MRRRFASLLCILATSGLVGTAFGQDTGATGNGNWENASIWTGGTVPGSSNNVYIGSTYPSGAASTATVTLTANESASNVYLGNGSGTSGTLDLGGNTLTIANNLVIGQSGGTGTLSEGGGSFTATNLYVENGNSLTFGGTDAVTTVQLSGASSVTTTAAGNITGGSYTGSNVESGSTLNLGANLNYAGGSLNVQDSGSTLNMNGHSLTGYALDLGWNGTAPVTVTNAGLINVSELYVGNGTALTMHGGDVVGNSINLTGGSVLTVDQVNGTGLTLNGTSSTSLTIDPSSMDLVFSTTTPGSWDFRWLDPSSGNWISTIDTMIADGQIKLALLPGETYDVAVSGGYTYVFGVGGQAVPEPSSIVLACIAGGGLTIATAWRRRRSGH